MLRRLSALILSLTMVSGFALACGSASPSCASTMDQTIFRQAQLAVTSFDRGGTSSGSTSHAPSSGGTHSSSGSTSSGTGRAGSTPSKAPTNSGNHTSSNAPTSSQHNTVNAPSVLSPKSSYSPPKNSTIVIHGSSYPTSFGHSYSYGGHLYVLHSRSYYAHLGRPDPQDPYDYRNFTNPLSPFYGIHLHC